MSTPVTLALGSNLGDRAAALNTALLRLGEEVRIRALSSLYETAPMYVTDQPAFLNMVISGETEHPPLDLLDLVKRLEVEIGRVPSIVNGPRAIDIDILFHGNTTMETERLTLPHPRISERAFVLIPLSDIDPDRKIGPEGARVQDLARIIPGGNEVQKADIPGFAKIDGVAQ